MLWASGRAVVNAVLTEDFQKLTYEQRPKGREGASHPDA